MADGDLGTERRSRHRVRGGVTSAAILGAMSFVLPTRADEVGAADIGAARALAVEGIKLADAGKCREAIDKLARAERLHHAPTILVRLGECRAATGRIVEGTENLRRVLQEQIPAGSPPAYVQAKERAQSALDVFQRKIAWLVISIETPAATKPSVMLDGQPVASALLDAERPTDPGDHLVEVSARGFLKATAKVSLAEGAKQSVSLRLEPDPSGKVAAPEVPAPLPTASATKTAPQAPRSQEAPVGDRRDRDPLPPPPDKTHAYVALGIGIAGAVTGTVLGWKAYTAKQDLDQACPHGACPMNQQDQLDSARLYGRLSTIAYGAGGAGLAMGVVFLLLANGETHVNDAPSAGAHAYVTPTGAGISGTF